MSVAFIVSEFLNICLKITVFSDCLGFFKMRNVEAQTNDLPSNKLLHLYFFILSHIFENIVVFNCEQKFNEFGLRGKKYSLVQHINLKFPFCFILKQAQGNVNTAAPYTT